MNSSATSKEQKQAAADTQDLYIDKELSWLSFNERVLQEASDKDVPLIERVRFLGIYSNNQDEFFRVRVADVKRRVLLHQSHGGDERAAELLGEIEAKVIELDEKFGKIWQDILSALKRRNIHLVDDKSIADHQVKWVKTYFKNKVLPHITPVIVTKKVELEKSLRDYATYLVVEMCKDGESQHTLIEVPTDDTPRFIQLPEKSKTRKSIILLDDMIRYCLDILLKEFFDYDTVNAYSIKLTRDAEYDLSDEIDQSLIEKMSEVMKQRGKADPVRIVYDQDMPDKMLKFLKKKLKLGSYRGMQPGNRYRNFKDFIGFPNVGRAYLENPELPALVHKELRGGSNAFDSIKNRDILLYYPYHRFTNFTEMLRQAAFDPKVKRIQLNVYRVAKNSRIMGYLMDAVRNGKTVSIIIELRARFDEEANMAWAQRMTDAGLEVVAGIPSLKIHSKLCLITRLEDDQLVRYAHIGTGNFHEGTARIYTDFSLMTADPEITREVESVFQFVRFSYRRYQFKHLLVSPVNTRHMLYKLINQEIKNVRDGQNGSITLKVNNLQDRELIQHLYAASQSGVKIRMIIRGMCCLVPGIKGVSDNISIISIVDRFLEHPRVMVFHNNGDKKVYISSGDLMTRNIDNRVEVACPIYDPALKQRIIDILDLQFKDRAKARIIDAKQQNRYVPRGNRKKLRSQIAIYDYLKAIEHG